MHIGKAGSAGPKCKAKGFRTHTILEKSKPGFLRPVMPRDLFKVLPARPGRKQFEVVRIEHTFP